MSTFPYTPEGLRAKVDHDLEVNMLFVADYLNQTYKEREMDFAKIIPALLKLDLPFEKIADAIKFFEKYKAQIGGIVAFIGGLLATFKVGRDKTFEDGQPPIAGLPPISLPPVAPLPPPAPAGSQVARLDLKVLFIEGRRDPANPSDGVDRSEVTGSFGGIVSLERFKAIVAANGTDAVRVGERIHFDVTPRDAAGRELPRDLVRAMKKADGSPAFDWRWKVAGKKNWNSVDEPDRFHLESYDDQDNGCTPTYLFEGAQPGRHKGEWNCLLAAEDNQGLAVESGVAVVYVD